MFVGNGFDIHKHSPDRKLFLGGLSFDGDGFVAHSDGDIILHALSDALLGALGKKDLGYYFPSDSSTPKDIESIVMFNKVLEIIEYSKYVVSNIDITVLSESINISSKRDAIEKNIAALLDIDETKKLVSYYFDEIPNKGDKPVKSYPKEKPFEQKRVQEFDPNIQIPALFYAFRTPSATERDSSVLNYISTYLSGGESSVLYKKLVDEKGFMTKSDGSQTSYVLNNNNNYIY